MYGPTSLEGPSAAGRSLGSGCAQQGGVMRLGKKPVSRTRSLSAGLIAAALLALAGPVATAGRSESHFSVENLKKLFHGRLLEANSSGGVVLLYEFQNDAEVEDFVGAPPLGRSGLLIGEARKIVWFNAHFLGDLALQLKVLPTEAPCYVYILVEPVAAQGYVFILNSYHTFGRTSGIGSPATAIGKYRRGASPAVLKAGSGGMTALRDYSVTIARKGSELKLWINRRLCVSARDRSYTSGRIGFRGPYSIKWLRIRGQLHPRWYDKALSLLGDGRSGGIKGSFKEIQFRLGAPPGFSPKEGVLQLSFPYQEETEHYKILSNVSKSFTHRTALFAEKMYKLYSKIFPVPKKEEHRSRIYIFNTEREFRLLGVPGDVLGFYSPKTKDFYLFDHVNQDITREVLLHEGFHQFIDLILDDVPLWFNEGMAQYFQTAKPVAGGFKCGELPTALRRLQYLRGGPILDFPLISDPDFRDGFRIYDNYAKAWGLCYFLIHYDGGRYFPVLKKYFEALRRGESRKKAYAVSFGRLKVTGFERQFRRYMRKLAEGK